MPLDSSTGGYLSPAQAPAPLEGQALSRFLQQWIVGITGLPGTLVVPAWQPEPPSIPVAGTAWAAFKIARRPSDEYPFIGHNSAGNGSDTLQRHEELELLLSFYDLGVNGQADNLAAVFRDGTAIAQNRETLTNAGMGLVRVGQALAVPVLFKMRWQYRVDIEAVIRRQINRTYSVLSLQVAHANLYTDTGIPPQTI